VRFTLRDYQPDDFNTLWAIDQSCFEPGISYSRYELRVYLRRWGAFTLVAESSEPLQASAKQNLQGQDEDKGDPKSNPSIVAFIIAESSRRGKGHIITIDVRASARRHNIGSALLEAAEKRLLYSKCDAVRLETAVNNAPAISFYKRHGYDVIQVIPHYYSDGVDALLLEKNLLSNPHAV
jgi:[ribosomal protein S18]-alanine N-acetyltransferase